jgi:capsular exopolysaccharide synthesis family protein
VPSRPGGADQAVAGPGPDDRERAETDHQVVGFARGGSLNLVGAVCNQVALLGVTLLLARRLGRADVGLYAQAYAFLALLAPLAVAGLGVGMTRFVAVHLAERDVGGVRGTVRLGLTLGTASAAVLGATLYVAAPWLVEVAFRDPELVMPLRFVSLALPAAAFTDVALAATQGYRTMKPFAVIGLILEPVLRMGLVLVLLVQGMGLRGVMTAVLASHLVTAVLAGMALRRVMGRPSAAATYRPRELLRFSVMSWLASFASTGLIWADILLLGLFTRSTEVGVYSVATRLVHLATFVMLPINAAFAPRIADLYHRGRTESLRRTYGVAASWIIRLSLPAFVILVVFPGELLAFFGRGFMVGAAVTVVLAVGKFVDAATGPCGLMLNMSGRPALNVLDNLIGLAVNVGLNLLLIPRYGILGSAVAWAVSLTLINLARVVQVWKALGMLPFDAGIRKGLVAAAAALAAALLVRAAAPPHAGLAAGVAAVAAVYLAASRLQGFTAEDRLVFGALLRRRVAPEWAAPQPHPGPGGPQEVELPLGAPAPRGLDLSWPTGTTDGRATRRRPARLAPPRQPRQPSPASPARYARALWQRRLLVLAGLPVGLALGLVVLPTVLPDQPTYRAAVRIDVRPFGVDLAGGTPRPAADELASSVRDIDIAAVVVRELGRRPAELRATRQLPPDQWPSGLVAALEVSPVPGSGSTIELALVDESPVLARSVVGRYARRYAERRNADDQARTRGALAVLRRQAGDLRLDLLQWGQQVDQERATSPTGTASVLTTTQFEAFAERYRAKLAQQERLRERVALRGRATRVSPTPTLRSATVPLGPAWTLAVGLLVGLLGAVVLALLLEAVQPRLVGADDAAMATGVDVLARVPRRRHRPRRAGAGEDPAGAQAEAYRRLALQAARQGLGQELHVLAVVSADPGEGRSSVAVGLAQALAEEGRGVMILSGDLRRPVVERVLGVPDRPGLAEYLEGPAVDVVSLLITVRENLLLLPTGWVGRSPSSLLARPNLARALDRLRGLSLIVLVDTPPARWWADALSLAAEADAIVLVARSGRSRWRAVAELAGDLHQGHYPVLGTVLVGARRPRGRSSRRTAATDGRRSAGRGSPEPAGNGNRNGDDAQRQLRLGRSPQEP